MESKKVLNGDLPRIIFLIAMFLVEGIPYTLLVTSYLINLKKHYNYSEIGVIQMCSFAIPCKIVFSTMVQNCNCKLFGEKKSWIIPTSICIGVIFIYLGFSINSIHTEKKYYMLTFLFSLIMMCMGIHEIALSSWSISLLKKENIGYAASCKVLGNYAGSFISGCLFYSLNSVKFCNSYIYNSQKSKPIIDDQDFMFYVGIYSIVASAVCFVLYDEKEDQNPDIQVKRNFHQLISVASNMISNKNLLQ